MKVSDEAELERIAEQYASEGWQAATRDTGAPVETPAWLLDESCLGGA